MLGGATLDGLFRASEDFLHKSFRETSKVRVSIRSILGNAEENGSEVKVSPRVELRRDGTTTSKLKVGFSAASDSCLIYQRVAIDQAGQVAAKVTVEGAEGEKGQTMSGGVNLTINTVAAPTHDVYEAWCGLVRPASYLTVEAIKASAGEAVCDLRGGLRFFNGVVGVHHRAPVHASQDIDAGSTSVGLGFHGELWAVAGRIVREGGSWVGGSVISQTQRGGTTRAVSQVDINLTADEPQVVGTLGVEHTFRVPLQHVFRSAPLWPVTAALKVSTVGPVAFRVAAPVDSIRVSALGNAWPGRSPQWGVHLEF